MMQIKIPLYSKFYLFLVAFFSLTTQPAYSQDTLTFGNDAKQKLYEQALPKFKAKLDSTVKIALTYKGYTIRNYVNIRKLVGNSECKETFTQLCLDKIYDGYDSLELDSGLKRRLTELLSKNGWVDNFIELYLRTQFINSQVIEIASAASICYWEKLHKIEVGFNDYLGSKKWTEERQIIKNDMEIIRNR